MSIRSFSRADMTRRLFNTPLAVLPSTAAIVLGVVGPRFDVSQLLMHAGGEQRDIGELVALATTERAKIDAKRTSAEAFPASGTADWRMDVQDGVAHINVRGELVAENGGGVNPSSGFTGYDAVLAAWTIAQRDSSVKGIIADINSPGGEVTDLMELVAQMMADRGKKPTRAIIRGVGASAAYAIAACCDEITVQDLGYAGSVGVITMHADFSGQLEQAGVKVTLIHAGAHKADGNPFEALPDDVRASIQTDIDHAYGRFVAHVAAARGMTEDAVRATEARVYRGEEAVKAGLADKVMGWADSQAEFVAAVNGRQPATSQRQTRSKGSRASMETAMPGEPDTTQAAATLVTAGISALTIVGSAAHASALASALAAGGLGDIAVNAVEQPEANAAAGSADAERTRILALTDLCPETTMSASLRTAIEGNTSAGDFAIGLAQAAKSRGASVADLKAGAVQPDQVPATANPSASTGKPKTGAQQATGILALAQRAGHAAVGHLKG